MRKLTVVLCAAIVTLACSNVSSANAVSESLPLSLRPSFSHTVLQLWDAGAHARQTVEAENALVGSWYILLDPASPISPGEIVTIYAIYSGSDPTVGGTLDVQIKKSSATCYGADAMLISCTLPSNPTDGVPYDIGSFSAYNACGENKVLKVNNVQSSVDGAPIYWQQSINVVVTP